MRRLVLIAALVLTSGCSALLSPFPTSSQQSEIRQTAARIADGILVAEVALDAAGQTIDALPLTTAQKDALDCGILKVNGHDAPSATVLKACGAIPSAAEAPVGKALAALRTATARPGLCGSVTSLLTVLEPLIASLDRAGANIGTLRVALGFTLQFAGGCR